MLVRRAGGGHTGRMDRWADRGTGLLLVAITLLVILREWGLWPASLAALPVLVVALAAIFAISVRASRKAFIAVAAGLTVALAVTDSGWWQTFLSAIGTAAFIAAFFSALSSLRNVAQTSPAIQRAGRFLAAQPPGRRYAALTVGGQAFALLLNYGAMQLLGAMAMANASKEPDPVIRGHRIRRMLLAIQRAFISTLPWSPLSFAVAITTAIVPGSSWAQAALPGLVTGAILAGIGWGLDTVFKPRLTGGRPVRAAPQGSWASMLPLLALLAILVTAVTGLYLLSGVRVVGLVTVIVPIIGLVWLAIQYRGTPAPARAIAGRVRGYLFTELPAYRGELTLLMMAGYIGTVGAQLLGPLLARAGIDPSAVPAWVILAGFVWIIPLAGQIGMNPILAAGLIAPVIPSADSLGVTPTAVIVAITAGWALSGASSPFTASTLLTSNFSGIRPLRVGLVWNGVYVLLSGLVLSGWVLLYGLVLT